MAVTDTSAQVLFSYALGRVRREGLDANGNARVNQKGLIRHMWERFGGVGEYAHSDMINAVKRAVGAREGAYTLEQRPDSRTALLDRHYAEKPVNNRRSGRYEYRVIVQVSGADGVWDWPVTIQTRDKRSANELDRLARREFQSPANLTTSYRNKIIASGPDPVLNTFIVSATKDTT